jgi:hypothetical protein
MPKKDTILTAEFRQQTCFTDTVEKEEMNAFYRWCHK